MAESKDKRQLRNRLHRIQGQVAALESMIMEDKPCRDILIQINAAQSALHKLGQALLTEHIEQSLTKGVKKSEVKDAIERFEKELELFSRIN